MAMVHAYGFMGGPPTDLKNMTDRQEWKGQRFNKKTCKKAFIIKNLFHTI